MSNYTTEQEKFWAGEFGTDYISRNQGANLLASNIDYFSKALSSTRNIQSCIEFGANIGMNMKALKLLYPHLEQHAIEINAEAVNQLQGVIPGENIYHTSILDFEPERDWDLVITKGVLIHLNPDILTQVYEKLVTATSRYLLIGEYYNPAPVAIPYRGHTDRLFKRDFAGEVMDGYPHMKLRDYGFSYHRDPNFPQDDITWFLLEKEQ